MDSFLNAVKSASVRYLKSCSPIKTGNLRYNSIKVQNIDDHTAIIYVDEDIAPYMPFTNEPWISPKWHGRRNPNERWFDYTAQGLADTLPRLFDLERET